MNAEERPEEFFENPVEEPSEKVSEDRFAELWTDFLEGEISPAGLAELEALLHERPQLQTRAGDLLQTHRLLSFALEEGPAAGEAFVRQTLAKLPRTDASFHQSVMERIERAAPAPKIPGRRRSWHSAAAVAAGVLLGIVCTTVVFAYVAPARNGAILPTGAIPSSGASTLAGTTVPSNTKIIFQENFETGPAPETTGVPLTAGRWSGDFSEIVAEQNGVRPAGGLIMLRFLRGDYQGRSLPESFGSDVFRLIDLSPYRRDFADGDGIVQLTALFNTVPFPDDGGFECTLTVFALDAETAAGPALKIEGFLSRESLAYSRSSRLPLDRDPATWQKLSNELRLPPEARYLMVRVGVSDVARRKGNKTAGFTGQYVDRVQLVIARRPEIFVP